MPAKVGAVGLLPATDPALGATAAWPQVSERSPLQKHF